MNLATLRMKLKLTRDAKQRRRLQQLIAMAEAERDPEPRRLLILLTERILAAATLERSESYLIQILDNHFATVLKWLAAVAVSARTTARREILTDLWQRSNAVQRRGLLGLPVDKRGMIKPPPAIPPPLEIDDPTEAEVLEHISGLLVIDGDTTEQKANDPLTPIIEKLEQQIPVAQIASAFAIREIARQAQESLIGKVVKGWRRLSPVRSLKDWFADEILKPLGLKRTRPEARHYADHVGRDAASLKVEQRGAADREIADILGGDTYVGYQVFSAFASTTRPHHAGRSGMRFYVDNREGSYKPWSERVQPPYYYHDENAETGLGFGGNCLCFTVPILETPEGDEYSAEFGVRNSGGTQITARDVQSLSAWFQQQRSSVRRAVIGDRWDTLGDPTATLADFYNLDGSLVSKKQLAQESEQERRSRRERVQALFAAQHRRHVEAWQFAGRANFVDGDPVRERQYLLRLRAFLKSLNR